MCRCGANRRDLEERGIALDTVLQIHPAAAPPRRPRLDTATGRALLGYRSDADVALPWRLALKTLCVVGLVVVGALMIRVTHREPEPARGNIHIISTLDEFTRDAAADAPNTIPAFLELPGRLGILQPSSDPEEPVRAVNESDLREGFCSPSVAKQIRHQYPGFYDAWSDDKLERIALEKYPEMRDRTCALSYKLDATSVGVIKYELKPRTIGQSAGAWLPTLVVTAAFALACANLYYRLLVGRLAAA